MKYILDVLKWRCGTVSSNTENSHGIGQTALENIQGYMCCIGQFTKQTLKDEIDIIGMQYPTEVAQKLNRQYDKNLVKDNFTDTMLTIDLASINDNTETTINQKIEGIKFLLSTYNIELEVIPVPEG